MLAGPFGGAEAASAGVASAVVSAAAGVALAVAVPAAAGRRHNEPVGKLRAKEGHNE